MSPGEKNVQENEKMGNLKEKKMKERRKIRKVKEKFKLNGRCK
jgi:hypothetical protein